MSIGIGLYDQAEQALAYMAAYDGNVLRELLAIDLDPGRVGIFWGH
jgi:hypothetical protein